MKGNSLNAIISIASALLVLAGAAVSCAPRAAPGGKVNVMVSILPQADFVDSVGGERVTVSVMVPPGASPHAYEPKPSQIAALSRAAMYAKVGSGVEFELTWMDKLEAANRDMLVVDSSRGVPLMREPADSGGGGAGAVEPHIWLSPLNARVMVQNIYDGLVQLDPAGQDAYRQNRDAYLQKLSQLDSDIRGGLSRISQRSFMVYHPAFGYFARDYHLTMLTVAAEGKEPSAADIARLIAQAKGLNIKVIFASPQYNPQSAEVIAREIGGRVVFIDPLARDYAANLRLVLAELVKAGGGA